MKIGIVSDIHAMPKALRRALDDMPSVDRLFCAGDAVSEYQFCAETVEILQQAEAQCIQGNHEWVLFGGSNPNYLRKCEAEFAPDLLEVLAAAPTSLEFEAEGAKGLMIHASPWNPFKDYIMPRSPQLAQFAELRVVRRTGSGATQRRNLPYSPRLVMLAICSCSPAICQTNPPQSLEVQIASDVDE
jgi:predicted phosphodiesterase